MLCAIYGLEYYFPSLVAPLLHLTSHHYLSYAVNPIIFTQKIVGGIAILVVYMDDLLVTRSDEASIHNRKDYLQQHLNICDLGILCYFLGLEFAYLDGTVAMIEQKYTLDLLREVGLFRCKPKTSPMEA